MGSSGRHPIFEGDLFLVRHANSFRRLDCDFHLSGRDASNRHVNTKSKRVRSMPTSEGLAKEIREYWQTHGPFTNCLGVSRIVLRPTSIKLPRGQVSHVLRHTFASHFIMNGGHIVTLQHIPGARVAVDDDAVHTLIARSPSGCCEIQSIRGIAGRVLASVLSCI